MLRGHSRDLIQRFCPSSNPRLQSNRKINEILLEYLAKADTEFSEAKQKLESQSWAPGTVCSLSLHLGSLYGLKALSMPAGGEQEAIADLAIEKMVQVLSLQDIEEYLSDRDTFALVAVLSKANDAFNKMFVEDFRKTLMESKQICSVGKAFLASL